ncbi:hypothetical protein PF004_g31334 [Phytophthora fragariae]|uniref:Uncharacterized protein n=1 Tax=Phytophthora fragariae TaxID=53985 RepID=A0A6G0MAB4_9STRA|nr:hypothetical protein PF004_g31334 [Phytophthora fragariae]
MISRAIRILAESNAGQISLLVLLHRSPRGCAGRDDAGRVECRPDLADRAAATARPMAVAGRGDAGRVECRPDLAARAAASLAPWLLLDVMSRTMKMLAELTADQI